ncbi:hypothetical protein M408DRAFT_334381 [Serendipita vermifera MAFF 305830]|uniref:Uncharacterized protein n=1 Tax=Serendipita vermifera MAFF 305830 TaxID=933852 RepID=A0A0C3AJI8_SERVB|nr:hypothetical protein M408DRAFT_334381 [Serendipita vermifera MAFF 305830]
MVALDATTILATTITVATEGPIPAVIPVIPGAALVTVEDRARVVEEVDVIKRTNGFAFFLSGVYSLVSFLILYRT